MLEEEEKKMQEDVGGGNGDVGGLRLDGVREDWEEDVAAVYERGVGELRRLGRLGAVSGDEDRSRKGSLTETVGRVQRAKMVALELE